ncbi:hypothetical protein WOC23_23080 [Vibrio parahaemolyticus]
MPARRAPNKNKQANVLGAGAAGGSIGTMLATFADSLPPDSNYKTLLTVTAPLITIGISGLWLFIKGVYIDPYAAKKKHEANHQYLTQLITDARNYEQTVITNPNSTDKHKKEVRAEVEKLEKLLMRAIVENVELVAN